MAGYKGIGAVFVRGEVRAAGPEVEARVLEELSPDERAQYESVVATGWIPIELITKLFVVASPLLYPGEPRPIRRMGKELARHNLGGVYRFLVRVLTVPFLMDQTAVLWKTYHAAGQASVVRLTDRQSRLEVRNYPELPERFRECMCGWIAQAIEMTGAMTVQVVKSDDDPRCWSWTMTWR